MAVVYLARDTRLGRRVAIKFVKADDKAHKQRFLREAQATARCNHLEQLLPERAARNTECGLIGHYDGLEWQQIEAPSLSNIPPLLGMFGTKAGHLFATGAQGHILHRPADSDEWQLTELDNPDWQLISIWGSHSERLFAVGTTFKLSTDSGLGSESGTPLALQFESGQWSEMRLPEPDNWRTNLLGGVWGLNENNVYAVGQGEWVTHYDGNPQGEWRTLIEDGKSGHNHLLKIASNRDGELIAVGDATLSLQGQDGTRKLDQSYHKSSLVDVWPATDSRWFAVTARSTRERRHEPQIDLVPYQSRLHANLNQFGLLHPTRSF